MTTRIVQMTDPHLLSDEVGLLRGVPVREAFRDVLDHAAALEGGFDHLVLSGDIADDEAAETYRILGRLLGPWRERCHLVPGNHDERQAIREALPDRVPDGAGPLTFSFPAGGWRVLGLDSHLTGEVSGRLDEAQLDWLEGELDAAPGTPALVFLHHPPMPIGVPYMDEIALQSPERLRAVLECRPQVKAVAAGHVHRAFEGVIGTAAFYTTPSTAFQFGGTAKVEFEPIAPGYRIFDLAADGTFRTRVARLPALRYPPDLDAGA